MKVAASAVSAAMGPIEVVPGSVHSPPDSAHAATALPLPLPVGAVNIYDARLWHRGGKNRSQQPRMLFYVTVVGDGPPPAGLPEVKFWPVTMNADTEESQEPPKHTVLCCLGNRFR